MHNYYTYFSDYDYVPPIPLSAYRREKISRLQDRERIKKEIICEHFLSKCLLTELPDLALPLPIAVSERGKPSLAGTPLHFSLSHCDNLLVVVTDAAPVGVDCEKGRETTDYLRIARRFFPQKEQQEIQSRDDFLRLWTMKEAYAKKNDLPLVEALKTDMTDLGILHTTLGEYHIAICTGDA